jgi:hypothetical protein
MTAAHLRPRGTNSGYNRKSRAAVRFLNLTGQQPPNASRGGLAFASFGTQSCAAKDDHRRRYSFDISSERCSRPDAQPQRRGVSASRQERSIAMPSSGRVEDRGCAWARPLSTRVPAPSSRGLFGTTTGRRSGFLPMQRIEAHATSTPDDDLLFSAVSLSCTGGAIQGNKVWAPLPPGALAVRATQGF